MHATDTDVHKGELRAIYLLFTVIYYSYSETDPVCCFQETLIIKVARQKFVRIASSFLGNKTINIKIGGQL